MNISTSLTTLESLCLSNGNHKNMKTLKDSKLKSSHINNPSFKGNLIPNIEGLKICPNNSYSSSIKIILSNLKQLQKFSSIVDEIQAIILLIQSIDKKIYSDYLSEDRLKNSSAKFKEQIKKASQTKNCSQPLQQLRINDLTIDQQSDIKYLNLRLPQFAAFSPQLSIFDDKQNMGINSYLDEANQQNFMPAVQIKQIVQVQQKAIDAEIDQINRQIRDLDRLLHDNKSRIQ